ncbi:MAG: hypothetical protein P8J30_05675 [Ilumatobacter sp.]|nr:hypothetical protein [Ilumatobacter sp.]
MSFIWVAAVWFNVAAAAMLVGRSAPMDSPRGRWVAVGGAVAFAALLWLALRDIVNVMWFEDDALITFQYSKNLAEGCGWNFNCNGDDFATSSYLQTAIGSLWFLLADVPRALHIEKLWENALVIWGSAAFMIASVRLGASRVGALLAIGIMLLTTNSFQFLFSGMENALGFAVLSFMLLAYSYERFSAVGLLVGVAALVRPEYGLAGGVIAMIDLAVHHETVAIRDWLRRWIRSAALAVVAFLPLFSIVWALNGTPFADTLEIKRLTAPNWGALYHEEMWPLANDLGPALVIVALGFVGLLLHRSPLLFFPLFACLVSVVYWRLGLPRSPWYYMPFWTGLAACTMGFPFFLRRLKDAWGVPSGWGLGEARLAVSALAAITTLWVAVGNPITTSADNLDFVERVAAKRLSINAATGLYLNAVSEPGDAVAVPNIGYVGFYSDRFIVDLVGLVTPDASLRVTSDGWQSFSPRYYVDKIHIGERLVALDGYEFKAIIGPGFHRGERFMIVEQASSSGMSNSMRLDGETGTRSDDRWIWEGLAFDAVDVVDGQEQVYVSVNSSACPDAVDVLLVSDFGTTALRSYYTNRGGFAVIDSAAAADVDWGSLTRIDVRCVDAPAPASSPIVTIAVAERDGA